MKHKIIMLPWWLMETLYWLAAIILIPTAVVEVLLELFKWMKWRFHLVALALCGVLGCYLLIIGRANAFFLAAQAFIAIVVIVAIMKLLRLLVNKFRFCLVQFRQRYPLVKNWFIVPAFMCPKFLKPVNYEQEAFSGDF